MKERPILMSAPMVQAILDGRKTQTRRAVKFNQRLTEDFMNDKSAMEACPYGQTGDRLWCRETVGLGKMGGNVIYRADGGWANAEGFAKQALQGGKWTPSIHMKKIHSRIMLEIVSVRIERAQDISEADAIAEGGQYVDSDNRKGWRHDVAASMIYNTARESFRRLWIAINGEPSWNDNPWVWVIEFKRVMT